MMRRIEAEERLAAIKDGAAAAGNLERNEGRKHQARLQRAAHGADRPRASKARPETIAAMGIAVTMPLEPAEKGVSDG